MGHHWNKRPVVDEGARRGAVGGGKPKRNINTRELPHFDNWVNGLFDFDLTLTEATKIYVRFGFLKIGRHSLDQAICFTTNQWCNFQFQCIIINYVTFFNSLWVNLNSMVLASKAASTISLVQPGTIKQFRLPASPKP